MGNEKNQANNLRKIMKTRKLKKTKPGKLKNATADEFQLNGISGNQSSNIQNNYSVYESENFNLYTDPGLDKYSSSEPITSKMQTDFESTEITDNDFDEMSNRRIIKEIRNQYKNSKEAGIISNSISYTDLEFHNVVTNRHIVIEENGIDVKDQKYTERSQHAPEIQNNKQTNYVLEKCELNKQTRIVRGDFHQGDKRFMELSRDKQGVAISVVVLCFFKINDIPASWKTADINSILINGDAQYHASYKKIKREGRTLQSDRLLISEVYPFIKIGRKYFCVSVIDHLCVGVVLNWNNLLTSLHRFFNENKNQYGVFACNTYSLAIMQNLQSFFLFNSYAIGESNGEPMDQNNEESVACFIEVNTIACLANYLLVACNQEHNDFQDDQPIFFSIVNINIEKVVFGKEILKRRKINRDLCITEGKRTNVKTKLKQIANHINHQSATFKQKNEHLETQTADLLGNQNSEVIQKHQKNGESRWALSSNQNECHTVLSACSFEFYRRIDPANNENQITGKVLIGCGMVNIGNSCFFNACLQAFFHIPSVNIHLQSIKRRQCTCVVCNIVTAFKETHTHPMLTPYDPSNLYKALRQGNEKLLNGRQQDAHEFWMQIMNVLANEINSFGTFDRLFIHNVESVVKCKNCYTDSRTCQEYRGHVIECHGRLTIQEAVNAYFAEEEALETYKCTFCHMECAATKTYLLNSVPNVLCLLLNRFKNGKEKNQEDVILNEQLKLSEFTYNLVSIINHIGTSPFNGHYTAIARSNKSFYEFNDCRVHNVDVISGFNAYMVIYEISSEIEVDNCISEADPTDGSQHDNENLRKEIMIENESVSSHGQSQYKSENSDHTDKRCQEEVDEFEYFHYNNMQCSDNIKIQGRRIVDIGFLFAQMQNLSTHSECCESRMVFHKETKLGLRSIFYFECPSCGENQKVQSCYKNFDAMNINEAATLGFTSIGSGFYHMEEVCAHLDIPCMSGTTYDTENKKLQEDWWKLAIHHAELALKEEIELAIARGDVDSAGYALIPVVCDGSWGKRSYGKGFSSLSGTASIIGLHTKKVLYFDVKNKYCDTCTKSYSKNCPPNYHHCNINYVGPSSGMETEIIVEGFEACQKMGARFHQLISDGDSSAFKEISDRRIYQNPELIVEKLECVNHVFKNFRKSFIALSSNTSFDVTIRKLIEPSTGDDICKGVRKAAEHWRKSNIDLNEKLQNLEKDCLNAPYHYYGNHDYCEKYFCKKTTTAESNAKIDLLKSAAVFYEILNLCNIYFASNVKSLLEGHTNNSAEELNNIIAKYLGGKRINYSLAGSYGGRVAAAVVQYNTKGHAGSEFHKFHNINVNNKCLNMENSRIRHYAKNEAARQVEPRKRSSNDKKATQKGYKGQTSDLSKHTLEQAKEVELAKLNTDRQNRQLILKTTFRQRYNSEWFGVRRKLINCSYFGRIINARGPQSYPKILYEMMYTKIEFRNTAEVRHQRLYESEALKMFSLVYKNYELEQTGLFIDEELGFLGASPLRLYGPDGIVNVKCPAKAFGATIDQEMPKKIKECLPLVYKHGDFCIKERSTWYIELQGQLHVTGKIKKGTILSSEIADNFNPSGRKFAYLVVWLGSEFFIQKVAVNHSFWRNQMKNKLEFFFNEAMIKELADPRNCRKMPLREYHPQTKTFI